VGSFSVVPCVRCLIGQPLCCSAAIAGMWGERGYGNGSTHYVWLSSISLLQWLPDFPPQVFPTSLLPHIPSICLQSTAALALGLLHNPSTPAPSHCIFQDNSVSLSRVCMAAARTLWFSLPLVCCRLAISLSALNVSPLTQTIAPMWGSEFSHLPRAGPVLLTLLFFPLVPSSYLVLHGSIYSFLLVRYSCPLSVGVLHALLCLKVYSWCIHGKRSTPRPPIPPPSYSLFLLFL